MKRSRGFTLLEVLVALAVLAIALLALMRSGTDSASVVDHVREQTLVAWVAANAVAQLRLEPEFPQPGSRSGVDTMGQQNWIWRGDIVATPDPDLLRFDVAVYRSENADDAVYQLSAFLGRY